MMIPLDRLLRGPYIRHQAIAETDDAMLAASIAETGGALTPILVRVAPITLKGSVGDRRKRLQGQAEDWRPPQAQFGAAGPVGAA